MHDAQQSAVLYMKYQFLPQIQYLVLTLQSSAEVNQARTQGGSRGFDRLPIFAVSD